MSLVFFSDPHLGKHLISHTTPTSRQRLKEKLDLKVNEIVHQRFPHAYLVCGGDLFDKFHNSGDVIASAFEYCRHLNVCLAGNHDLIADAAEVSSLQLLDLVADGVGSVQLEPDNFSVEDEQGDETIQLHVIPHVFTQTRFDDEIKKVSGKRNKTNILLLHCNYNSEFSTDETSLNLTATAAKWLLEERNIQYILLGHEHQPAKHFGGRLIIMGNTHPTSFGDIGDKFVWEFKGGKFTQHQIYSAEDCYLEVSASDVLNPAFSFLESLEWIRITGTVSPEDSVALMRIVRKAWELPNILAIKVDTTLSTKQTTDSSPADMTLVLSSIDQEMAEMGGEVAALWAEIKAEIIRSKEND